MSKHQYGEIMMGPGKEFDIIRRMIHRWGGLVRNIGDDAAILDVPRGERLIVSTDISVEGVHFKREWFTPQEIGFRSAVAALSDLAAMGATPLGLLVGLTVPDRWLTELDGVAGGIGAAVMSNDTVIVGGDTTRGEVLTLAITVLGHTRAPLRRTAAVPGDRVYVTGKLGGPLTALRALEKGETPSKEARERLATPMSRVGEGRWLLEHGARAAIDISDGLVADACHLAAASDARIDLDLDQLPLISGASALDAAQSGEEYELLVVSTRKLDEKAFYERWYTELTEIGMVAAVGNPSVVAYLHGERVDIGGGFDHFAPNRLPAEG
jgi:thiamine-monophosphate kinase